MGLPVGVGCNVAIDVGVSAGDLTVGVVAAGGDAACVQAAMTRIRPISIITRKKKCKIFITKFPIRKLYLIEHSIRHKQVQGNKSSYVKYVLAKQSKMCLLVPLPFDEFKGFIYLLALQMQLLYCTKPSGSFQAISKVDA